MRRLSPAVAVFLLTSCHAHSPATTPSAAVMNPAATEVNGPPAAPTRPSEPIPNQTAGAAISPGARIASTPTPPLPPAPAFVSAMAEVPKAPPHLPAVEDSKDNPSTVERVALGYALFFDKRLSKDGSMACEGCHHIDKAYTSGNALDAKVGGAMNKRNAPTMLNLAFGSSFYWDGRKPTLESVSQAAWTGQLGADPKAVAEKLAQVPGYAAAFQRAFNEAPTGDNIPKALGAFLRNLKSGNAPFDRFEAGDEKAVSKEAKAGFEVFKNKGCALCHVPPLYSDYQFHNIGIGVDKAEAALDHGRKDATKEEGDEGKFKTPSLRDVAKTGPYFHDGSVKTLAEAIDVMLAGGKKHPQLDEKLKPQKVTAKERAQLKAFLESLSGGYTFPAAPELP